MKIIKGKVLSIAGSDSFGGAGIQADIKTITALGSYAMTAITAITIQNTTGVKSIVGINPEEIFNQIVFSSKDIKPDAIKIGMLDLGLGLTEHMSKHLLFPRYIYEWGFIKALIYENEDLPPRKLTDKMLQHLQDADFRERIRRFDMFEKELSEKNIARFIGLLEHRFVTGNNLTPP